MSDPLTMISSRVKFLDQRTGDISREWYLLFEAIIRRIGGSQGLSNDDLAIGVMTGSMSPSLDALLQQISDALGSQPVPAMPPPAPTDQLDLRPAVPDYRWYDDQLNPVTYVGTLGEQNHDNVNITGGKAAFTGLFSTRGFADNATARVLTFTNTGIASFGGTISYYDEQVNIVGADTKLLLRSSAGYSWSMSNEGATASGNLTFRYEDGPLNALVIDRLGNGILAGSLVTAGGAAFLYTSTGLASYGGAGAGTLTNAPAAGNPTRWIAINDAGTLRYIPAWG